MKAHVKPADPVVLVYGLPAGTPEGDALRDAMAQCHLPVRELEAGHADCKVGDLADGRAVAAPNAEGPAGHAVLFSALSEKQLQAALAALRQAGNPAAVKAVVTPTSRTWTLRALMSELHAEHTALHGGNDQ